MKHNVMKIFSKLSNLVFWLFCLEYLVLSCELDLLPSCFMGVMCLGALYIKSKTEVETQYQDNYKKDVKQIINFLLCSLFVIVIFLVFFTFDISIIASYIIQYLNNYKWLRYILYGLVYPFICSYLMFYCWDNEKAISKEGITVNSHFYYILIVNLYLGFIICSNWESYFSISQAFLGLLN